MEKKETCDICGKECKPLRGISIPVKYFMNTATTIEMKVSVSIPCVTSFGDVCSECAKDWLKKWLESA